MSEPLSEHLTKCSGCRKQLEGYQEFRKNVGDVFTDTYKTLGPPDLSFLESAPPTELPTGAGGYRIPIRVAAATVFAVILGFGGFFTANSVSRRSVIRAEAIRFTEALFKQPLFDDGATGSDDLLIGSDILSELVLPVPQNEDLPERL